MLTQEQIKEINARIEALRKYLDIDEKRIRLEEEELRTTSPDFWADQKRAEEQMKKVKDIKSWIEEYDAAAAAVAETSAAYDMCREDCMSEEEVDQMYLETVSAIESLEMRNMLRKDEDRFGAVMKIVAGAGGTESQDWAEMLMRMYMRWCDSKGFKYTKTNYQPCDDAGIKTVSFKIEGEYAYGFLKSENGVHRLVRVSPYNAQGKRMTSFSSVFVVPLIDDSIKIEIQESNITWDTFRSGGKGGQNVNKVESGVRLHYKFVNPVTGKPDEIMIENTETRDQPKNKDNAKRLLKCRLYDLELEKRRQENARIEAKKKKIEWGAQIRSYVFDDRRVKDHRTDFQTSNVDAVMNGDIDGFIKAYLMEYGSEE